MAILKQEPVKAFAYQDHEAHIQTHMMALNDPKIQQLVGQSPFAAAIQSAMMSHITEHVALQYRVEIQKQLGVELPDPEAPMPEDIELQVSRLVAQAATKLFQKDQAEAAQQQAAAQQADPLTQIQQRELAIKEKELQHTIEMDKLRFELDKVTKEANALVQADRVDAERERAAANMSVKAAELDQKTKVETARTILEMAKGLSE
jgi:hypothetical protein